jgi:uncharacterized protein YjbJ (UPF0337 family)
MNEDKIVGKVKEVGGKLARDLGHATDNPDLEAEGAMTAHEGKAQYAHGEAREAAYRATHPGITERTRRSIQSAPWISVTATFAFGLAAGMLAMR